MDSTPKHIAALLLVGIISTVGLAGCEKDGPAENLGEDIDEAAQDAKREIEDATD